MTTKSKIKRVRWMAALTLALLFLSIASPIFMQIMPVWLPNVSHDNPGSLKEWEGVIHLIYAGLHLILFACIVVFFVRMLRGLGRGKIFVPGNARWLYIGAWLPLPIIFLRLTNLFFINGGSPLALTALVTSLFNNLAMFSGITLMALLYDIATDVSEENQLTV